MWVDEITSDLVCIPKFLNKHLYDGCITLIFIFPRMNRTLVVNVEETLDADENTEVQVEDGIKLKEIIIILFIMGIWLYSLYR